MNDATVRCLPGLADTVAAYVREVRVELADLPMDDVDDLTGGMEADLTELATESGGDLIGRLGLPGLYAAELRSAAGLPERAAGSGRRRRPLRDAVTRSRASFGMLKEQHPWLGSAAAFLVTLRPAWWLLRGYLAAWALWSILNGHNRGVRPYSFLHVLMALAAIVISVQLGRGWLRQGAFLRPLLGIANVLLVVAAFVASISTHVNYYDTSPSYSPPPGLSLDGGQVGNIYAYDSDGNRITGVRLFDQDGRPLNADTDPNGNPAGTDVNGNPVGVVRDSSGAPLGNVYPRAVAGSDPWLVTDPANPQVNRVSWTPPVTIVPLASSATPTPSNATTSTSAPVQPKAAPPTPTSAPSASVTRSGG
jgi:hypothetical protein